MSVTTSRAELVLDNQRAKHQADVRANRRFLVLTRFSIIVGGLAGWELLSGWLVRPFFISSPTAIASQLAEWTVSGELWYHSQFTITAAFCGYVVGAVLGVAVAWPLGLMPLAYRIAEPHFLVFYSIPAVAMAPVFILWFGLGMLPKILIAAYFVFFIVFINTVAGFQQVPKGLVDATRVMGASKLSILRSVILPSASPYILAALRITLPAAMIGAVTGEFISANRGLGYLTRAAASTFSTSGVLAGVLVLGSIVLIMNLMLRPLSKATRWKEDPNISGGTS